MDNQYNQIEQCLTILYTPNKAEDISKANAYLTSLITMSNYSLFKDLLLNSCNINAQYYSANSLTQLITSNYNSISINESESLILQLYQLILFNLNEDTFNSSQYLINGIIALMSRVMRLYWISQSFNKTRELLLNLISKAKAGSSPYQIRIAFRIITEVLCEYKRRDVPPLDKALRIIFDFKRECLEIICGFCFECLGLLINQMSNEENGLRQTMKLIKEISVCLSECIEFIHSDDNTTNKSEIKPILISDINESKGTGNENEDKVGNIGFNVIASLCEKLFFVHIQLQSLNSNTNTNTNKTQTDYLDHILIILDKVLYFTLPDSNTDKNALLSIYNENILSISSVPSNSISSGLISKLILSLIQYFPEESIASCTNIFSSLSLLLKLTLNDISTQLDTLINILSFYSSFTKDNLTHNQSYKTHCYTILTQMLNSISQLGQYEDSIDLDLINRFITSFAQCSKIVYNDIMIQVSNALLLDDKQQINQYHQALVIRLITKLLKYSYTISFQYEITSLIIAKILYLSFNKINMQSISDYYLNSIILFFKMFIRVFIRNAASKDTITASSTKYNANSNNQNGLIESIISLLLSSLYKISQSDSGDHLILVNKTLKVINDSMHIQFNNIDNIISYHIGCIGLSLTPFNQIVYKGIELITKGKVLRKDNKTILLIEISLFRLLLMVNEHSYIIKLVFDSISNASFQSTNPNLITLLDTLIALIKSISVRSDYELMIDRLSPYFDSLYSIFGMSAISFTIKNKVLLLVKAITNNKSNNVSFTPRQIGVPDSICGLILSLISKYIEFTQTNVNHSPYDERIYPISIFIKIAKNILINPRSQLYRAAISDYSYFESLRKGIFKLNFDILSEEETNSYLYKLKSIYEFIKIIYCNPVLCADYSKSIGGDDQNGYLDKVIKLITEGIDSLDNIILITSHQIIYQIGKQCIEDGKTDIVFSKYSALFVNVLNKLLGLVSKGDITSINEVASTILVLSIIYEKEIIEVIKEKAEELLNPNSNQMFINLFTGIEKNAKEYNINKFKAKLKEFAQGCQ